MIIIEKVEVNCRVGYYLLVEILRKGENGEKFYFLGVFYGVGIVGYFIYDSLFNFIVIFA